MNTYNTVKACNYEEYTAISCISEIVLLNDKP